MKDRLSFEKQAVGMMISLYCRRKHRTSETCPECSRLLTYAKRRIERCRFGQRKPVCSRCAIHCYNPTKQQEVRRVMRFSGPRMLFRHPLITARHLWQRINPGTNRV